MRGSDWIVVDEGAGQAGQHDGADERDPERGAQLLPGELQATGLAPARRVDRRLDHEPQLRCDEAHARAQDRHPDREGGVRQVGLDRREERQAGHDREAQAQPG